MANQEHLEVLKQGNAPWNAWRKHHLDIRPDLSGADLSGAILNRANLNGACLSDADLKDADFSNAYLNTTVALLT